MQFGQGPEVPRHGGSGVDAGVPQLEDVPLAVETAGEPRVPGPTEVGGEAGNADESRTARPGGQSPRRYRVPGGVVVAEGGCGEGSAHQEVHGGDDVARFADLPIEGRQRHAGSAAALNRRDGGPRGSRTVGLR